MRYGSASLAAVVLLASPAVAELGSPLYDDRVYGPTTRTYEGVGARDGADVEAMRRALEESQSARDALAESARENALLRREVEEARAEIDRLRFAPRPAPASLGAPAAWGAPEERAYIVKEGDTLGGIAARELGSRARWPEIHRMNRDVIPNANVIAPGQTLRLPPAAPSAR